MTAVTIQELSQSRKLLNSIAKQKASTLSFPSGLKNGTSWMLKSQTYHPFPDSKISFRTDENSIFDVHNPMRIKILNRVRLTFSHLTEHEFCHNFWDTVNPLCLCNTKNLLHCPLFSEQRMKLFESFHNLDNTLLNHCDDDLVSIWLYGWSKYRFSTNSKKLSLTAEFLKSTKRFDKPLFWIMSISMDRWRCYSLNKIFMCCRQHHANAMLTLGRRRVFNWLQLIANCYNFTLKYNIKIVKKLER